MLLMLEHQTQKQPAGWETARGGSMTSWKCLSTVLSTLTVFSACWEAKPGSKSCYLQWGKILSNMSMVKPIFCEVNILLEGLEIECFFWVFLFKTCVSEQFVLPFCRHSFNFLRCLSCAGMPLPFFLQRFVVQVQGTLTSRPPHPTPSIA